MRPITTQFLIFLTIISFSPKSHSQVVSDHELTSLIKQAKSSHSDGLIIYQQDNLILEWYPSGQPSLVDIKSITKSVTNLAIGYLVTRKNFNIDQPVYKYYPEWDQEKKRDITVRDLMTHTSGLLDSDFSVVEKTPDIVRLALASDLSHPVGKFYVYNNKAVNLLAGIIEKADGRKLDQLVSDEIFGPLGITEFVWPCDRKGNPYVMAFLKLYPKDLAKIGQLVLNQGSWNNKQLINSEWFEESARPGKDFIPHYGLLWELLTHNMRFVIDEAHLAELKKAGTDLEVLNKLETIKGEYPDRKNYYRTLRQAFGKDYREVIKRELIPLGVKVSKIETDGVWAIAGIGYLGQYLIIDPVKKIVAVRMINHYEQYNPQEDEFLSFPEMIKKINTKS